MDSFAQNEAVCSQINQLFHLLSNKGRFRIVCLLCLGEFCVNHIADVVGHGRLPNISQHLKMLTLAGVIERRRENQRIFYRLKDERVRSVIEFMRSQFLMDQANPLNERRQLSNQPSHVVHAVSVNQKQNSKNPLKTRTSRK